MENVLAQRLVNLCPHDVRIIRSDGTELVLSRPVKPARISVRSGQPKGNIDGIPILSPARYVQISELPEPIEGTMYVVSQITALAALTLTDRNDILYPGTAPDDKPRRSPEGKLQAVRCLVQAS